jgi:hypothetical protein
MFQLLKRESTILRREVLLMVKCTEVCGGGGGGGGGGGDGGVGDTTVPDTVDAFLLDVAELFLK